MAKKIQLTIAEPCHENWEGMTPVEKGKFCGSCQKQVVDFSNMSDRQVAQFFKKPSTGSVCGRFMTDQLDRDIEIPRKRIPWVKYFFQVALPAFLISIKASASKTQGQIEVKEAAKDTTRRPVYDDLKTMGLVARPQYIQPFMADTVVAPVKKQPTVKGEIAATVAFETVCTEVIFGNIAIGRLDANSEITGRVVDEKGEAVPFANIETGKTHKGIMAGEDGSFKIMRNWLEKNDNLFVSSAGFENKEVIVRKDYVRGELVVQLKSNVVLPEVVVTAFATTRNCRYLTGGVSIVKGEVLTVTETKDSITNHKTKLPVDENNLFIYPNPVLSGTTFSLSFKKMEEGYYQLHILNQSGQTIQQKEIWIDAEARLLNIDVPSVSVGSYFLVLINKKTGKKVSEKIIIQ